MSAEGDTDDISPELKEFLDNGADRELIKKSANITDEELDKIIARRKTA